MIRSIVHVNTQLHKWLMNQTNYSSDVIKVENGLRPNDWEVSTQKEFVNLIENLIIEMPELSMWKYHNYPYTAPSFFSEDNEVPE